MSSTEATIWLGRGRRVTQPTLETPLWKTEERLDEWEIIQVNIIFDGVYAGLLWDIENNLSRK